VSNKRKEKKVYLRSSQTNLIHILVSSFSFIFRGSLIGHPVENIRVVLTDGASHAVDSSELAFKLAAIYAFREVLVLLFFRAVFYHLSCKVNCINY